MKIPEYSNTQTTELLKAGNQRNVQGQSESEKVTTADLMNEISKKKQEIFDKVKNGDTQESIPLGGSSFTVQEWKKLMTKVDKNLEAVKQSQEERKEDQKEEILDKQLEEKENSAAELEKQLPELSDETLENLLLQKTDNLNTMKI